MRRGALKDIERQIDYCISSFLSSLQAPAGAGTLLIGCTYNVAVHMFASVYVLNATAAAENESFCRLQ